jgi:ribulose-5-phosphate 4-epimerase/fuculose-1-phosphate aldolase
MNQISTPDRYGQDFLSLLRDGPPVRTIEEERLHRKQMLAATFRLFARNGYDQGLAGHVTARDPGNAHHFWVNPLGFHFGRIRVSDLILVNNEGEVIEGGHAVNQAAFAIHSAIHAARTDVVAAAHTHSTHGKAFSTLGKLLDPLTQDSCELLQSPRAVRRLHRRGAGSRPRASASPQALGQNKAAILKNHGLLTVGQTVEAAAWRFIALDNAARAQLLAEAAGTPQLIRPDVAEQTAERVGSERGGILSFHPLWDKITAEEPDLLS